MSEGGQQQLRDAGYEVVVGKIEKDALESGALREFDAIVVRSATKVTGAAIKSGVADGGKLRVVARAGVGVDNVDIPAATESGVYVVNAPQSAQQSVVELTIGNFLASCRHLCKADRSLRDGKWEKSAMAGTELSGKNMGFIGFGRIAQGVARVAQAFGMTCFA